MRDATHYESLMALPKWVPRHVAVYVIYKALGRSMRQTAKLLSVQPSTVSRNVRKVSGFLSDPLYQSGVNRLIERVTQKNFGVFETLESRCINEFSQNDKADGKRSIGLQSYLKKLDKPCVVLAASQDLSSCAIIHKSTNRLSNSNCAVEKETAEKLAVSGFVLPCHQQSTKILTYLLSAEGRRNLNLQRYQGSSDTKNPASPVHYDNLRKRSIARETGSHPVLITGISANKESSLEVLARRRDRYGNPFLSTKLVEAGKLLREDYEMNSLSICSVDKACNKGANGHVPHKIKSDFIFHDPGERLEKALEFLGPVLADVAVQCCCHFKGMEEIERDFGWSARSGKIVLRIALTQLLAFYKSGDLWTNSKITSLGRVAV